MTQESIAYVVAVTGPCPALRKKAWPKPVNGQGIPPASFHPIIMLAAVVYMSVKHSTALNTTPFKTLDDIVKY